MSIKLEAKNNQCYCDIKIDEFVKSSEAVQDALVNASIEVKGALYTMVLSEIPMLVKATGYSPESVIHVMSVIVGFDEQELKEFARTVQPSSEGCSIEVAEAKPDAE